MKTVMKVIGVIVVLVIVAAVYLVLNLDKGIKAAVETLGPKITQTTVTLHDVKLSLRSGEGAMRGLVIGNPAGYTSNTAFELGEISFALDTDSVRTDTLLIRSFHILAPQITIESGKNGTNLQQIQKNIASFSGDSTKDEQAADTGTQQKLIIQDLLVSGGKVSYSNPLLGDKSYQLELPELSINDIGQKEGGVTPAEAGAKIIQVISRAAVKAIRDNPEAYKALEGQLTERVEEEKAKIEEKKDELKGLLDQFKR